MDPIDTLYSIEDSLGVLAEAVDSDGMKYLLRSLKKDLYTAVQAIDVALDGAIKSRGGVEATLRMEGSRIGLGLDAGA